jgi:hypothetical protein
MVVTGKKQWYESLFENYAQKYDNENFTQGTIGECDFIENELKFDKSVFRDHNITEIEDDLGNKKTPDCNERYYVPCEITWLLKTLGFKKIEIFGAKLGAFSRNDKLTTSDFEMLVIAEK